MDGGVKLLCILVCCVQCFLCVVFYVHEGGSAVDPVPRTNPCCGPNPYYPPGGWHTIYPLGTPKVTNIT
jgi:hypothetical protein